jgi:chromosome partitioning protein
MSSYDDIPSFISRAVRVIERAAHRARLNETKEKRILRRFSIAECVELMNCDRSYLYQLLKHPAAPEGEVRGREKTLSVADIMKVRAIAASRPVSRKPMLFWRKPGEDLPVITISSQKGGTGKSVTAAHLAQFALLNYGLRVGIIDGDPQSTCSLYFVDGETSVAGNDVDSFTDFMGVPMPGQFKPGKYRKIQHSPEQLDNFWKRTPWPGLRLMPGGASIQEADIGMFFLAQSEESENRQVHRMLRDAIETWSDAHEPKTSPEDLMQDDGTFDDEAYQAALYETLDLIIIDTAPSLTLAQMNAVVAADMLCIPQTMKGFDLATASIYLNSLNDYFEHLKYEANPIKFRKSRPFILPTIVAHSTGSDVKSIGEIYAQDPDIISPVFYQQSAGVANAFEVYKSAYEYVPDKNTKESLQRFARNANAVNDAILSRAITKLPSRGYANQFIAENYPEGAIPWWTDNEMIKISKEDAA